MHGTFKVMITRWNFKAADDSKHLPPRNQSAFSIALSDILFMCPAKEVDPVFGQRQPASLQVGTGGGAATAAPAAGATGTLPHSSWLENAAVFVQVSM